MKKIKIPLIISIIILIIIFLSVFKLKSNPLLVEYPEKKEVLQSIAATGRVKAVKESIISSEITDIISKLSEDKGDIVVKGKN
ncbi:MAG TPA: hypothetical protein PL110_12725 [Candidatus Eremiobacteraeota bacterium]|nr:MAG: hypothetical protein BWY64_01750 [bacterium ADurb.Bin363]HPZ08975.1 hypothetical protein [Candidatus Eremiobacteraeota bacterium]